MGRTKVRKGRRAKVRKRTTGARTYAGRIWPGETRGAHTAQLPRAYVGTDVRAHVLGALLFVCPQRSHNPPEYVKQCPQRSHYVRTYLLKQTNDVRTYALHNTAYVRTYALKQTNDVRTYVRKYVRAYVRTYALHNTEVQPG